MEEGIVGLQIVGLDVDGVGGWVTGDDGLDGARLGRALADLIGEGLHVASTEGATASTRVSAAVMSASP